jgi:predicted metal-dependent hydrolase
MECMREWIAHGGNEKLQNFKNAHEALLDKWREHEDVWA